MAAQTGKRKALAFQEPYATDIMLGNKTVECRSKSIKVPVKGLVVCASKTASIFEPIPGLVYGYAIALVDVVDCVPFTKKHLDAALMDEMPEKDSYAWILENARPIKPFPMHATAGFFYVDDEPEVIEVKTSEDYKRYYLDIACKKEYQDGPNADDTIEMLFSR